MKTKSRDFAEIYGVIDKRKYVLEQETKIYQVEDVESDDAESLKSNHQIFVYRRRRSLCVR